MKAYSTDLRVRILEAVDKGMPKSEAARTFGVSRSSIKRYAAARREGRPLTPKKHPVDSTGRCNTLGFRCCLDRRCASGEAGSSRRVVRGAQEGVVGAV